MTSTAHHKPEIPSTIAAGGVFRPLRAFHEAGGRYVLTRESRDGHQFDIIAENLSKFEADRIVALEQAAIEALGDYALCNVERFTNTERAKMERLQSALKGL